MSLCINNILVIEENVSLDTYQSFLLAQNGFTIEKISNYRKIPSNLIVNHLIPYIYCGCFSARNKIIPIEHYKRISDYLLYHSCCDNISTIFNAMNKEIPYNDIKICYFHWHRIIQNQEDFKTLKLWLKEKYNKYDIVKQLLDDITPKETDWEEEAYDYESKYDDYSDKYVDWRDDTWDAMTNGEYVDYLGCDNFDWMR